MTDVSPPLVSEIRAARERLDPLVLETPLWPWRGGSIETLFGRKTELFLKLELCDRISCLDAVVIPIGGGGLCAGMAAAIKQVLPTCRVFGVEPAGAATTASRRMKSLDLARFQCILRSVS